MAKDLEPYQESDPGTWYGNQTPEFDSRLTWPWTSVYQRVLTLAGPRFQLQRYALTGQTQSQETLMHSDVSPTLPGQYRSYLIYLNIHWQQNWGGLTEFQLNDHTIHCEIPRPGKLVVFDSKTLHRGQAPVVPDQLRTTVVFHGRID